jgi:hypothetical protein
MGIEINAMNIVKYETVISYYGGFTVRNIIVTDTKGSVTEFKMYHNDYDPFEQKPITYNDYRTVPKKEGTFHEDVEATL